MTRNWSQKVRSRIATCIQAALCTLLLCSVGCAGRSRWGLPWGQGSTDRQKARAAVHDPFPLNDIGPEVIGGRPREYYNPEPEAARNQITHSSQMQSFRR